MKYLFILIGLCFACGGSDENECVELNAVAPIVCSDPINQGLFMSASCFSPDEAVETLQRREKALSDGSCVVPQYFRQAEPRVQPEPEIETAR